MRVTYPIDAYHDMIRLAYQEFIIGSRRPFASALPNHDRLIKDITRVREQNKGQLPLNWCYTQYDRTALRISDDDEFRNRPVITKDVASGTFSVAEWGYGEFNLNYFLCANNGSTIETCEVLYYATIYKIRTIEFDYMDTHWKVPVTHESLNDFGSVDWADLGTLFYFTWSVKLEVPILRSLPDGGDEGSIGDGSLAGYLIHCVQISIYGEDAEGDEELLDYMHIHPDGTITHDPEEPAQLPEP